MKGLRFRLWKAERFPYISKASRFNRITKGVSVDLRDLCVLRASLPGSSGHAQEVFTDATFRTKTREKLEPGRLL
jgi:hypothetical protein